MILVQSTTGTGSLTPLWAALVDVTRACVTALHQSDRYIGACVWHLEAHNSKNDNSPGSSFAHSKVSTYNAVVVQSSVIYCHRSLWNSIRSSATRRFDQIYCFLASLSLFLEFSAHVLISFLISFQISYVSSSHSMSPLFIIIFFLLLNWCY
jgi:hypothetical protein